MTSWPVGETKPTFSDTSRQQQASKRENEQWALKSNKTINDSFESDVFVRFSGFYDLISCKLQLHTHVCASRAEQDVWDCSGKFSLTFLAAAPVCDHWARHPQLHEKTTVICSWSNLSDAFCHIIKHKYHLKPRWKMFCGNIRHISATLSLCTR